jgi:formylmethanofuran dehydrogenase subunit E
MKKEKKCLNTIWIYKEYRMSKCGEKIYSKDKKSYKQYICENCYKKDKNKEIKCQSN